MCTGRRDHGIYLLLEGRSHRRSLRTYYFELSNDFVNLLYYEIVVLLLCKNIYNLVLTLSYSENPIGNVRYPRNMKMVRCKKEGEEAGRSARHGEAFVGMVCGEF